MNKKILTILIPTFNNSNSFLKIIKIYSKDPRICILVSDDSIDINEKLLIKEYCDKHKIKYFNGKRLTPAENWNSLLEKVNTPYFILNHHDEFPSNLNFLDMLNESNLGLLVLPCTIIDEKRNIQKRFSWQQFLFSKICLKFPNVSFNILLSPTACLVVKNNFKDILFDKNLKWFVDSDWYFHLFKKALNDNFKIKFFSSSRIISRQDEKSITYSIKSNLKSFVKLEKIYLLKKGLIPNRFISLLQFSLLILILSYSKLKQFLNSIFRFYFS